MNVKPQGGGGGGGNPQEFDSFTSGMVPTCTQICFNIAWGEGVKRKANSIGNHSQITKAVQKATSYN